MVTDLNDRKIEFESLPTCIATFHLYINPGSHPMSCLVGRGRLSSGNEHVVTPTV